MRLTALLLSFSGVFAFASACGDDGAPANQPDTVQTTDTSAVDDTSAPGDSSEPADTAVAPDTTAPPIGPGEPNYPANCTHTGFTPFQQQIGVVGSGLTAYQAANRDREPFDLVAIEFYGGEFGGASAPGTYDLSGSNYETCGNCVLVRTGCSSQGGCSKTFYADAGELVVTSWEPGEAGFKGFLDGVVLQEVTIDPDTFRSTPVADGAVWCLDQYAFEAAIAAPIVGGGDTQPTCVAGGNGTLVHDNVADFTLQNCLGESVSLHATCGESKALWFIGTAGWCTACHELLGNIVTQHGGSLTRARVDEVTPGLDILVVLGENQFGDNPSLAYCKAYAEGLGIDPAMVLVDHSVADVSIPLVDPEGYAIPVNSFATLWTHINPYLVAVGETVTTATPWSALLRGSNMEYMWSDDSNNGSFDGVLNTLLSE